MSLQKPLFFLLAVQTALIIFLSYRVIDMEDRYAAFTDERIKKIISASRPISTPVITPTNSMPFDVAEIRQMLREEITLAAEQISADAIKSSDVRAPATETRVRDAREINELRLSVGGEINRLAAAGQASQIEMDSLLQKVAFLPPSEREKALGEINRKINQGQISTQF